MRTFNFQVQLQVTSPSTALEMTRQSTATNGMTTLSRSALVQCDEGAQVSIVLVSGAIDYSTATENLVSFTGFQYGLSVTSASATWSFYYPSNWTAQSSRIDPFPINNQQFAYNGIGYVRYTRN